jgi:hypothetical protein
MNDLFKVVQILEAVLAAENPIQEARFQRQKVLREIEEAEKAMYTNYLKEVSTER